MKTTEELVEALDLIALLHAVLRGRKNFIPDSGHKETGRALRAVDNFRKSHPCV
jgi:hypothetical protein